MFSGLLRSFRFVVFTLFLINLCAATQATVRDSIQIKPLPLRQSDGEPAADPEKIDDPFTGVRWPFAARADRVADLEGSANASARSRAAATITWSRQYISVVGRRREEARPDQGLSSNKAINEQPAQESRAAARELLMEVFRWQETYFERHNRWATDLTQLDEGNAPAWSDKAAKRISLQHTSDGFRASLTVTNSQQQVERWCVDQTSQFYQSSLDAAVQEALQKAGANRAQLQQALDDSPVQQREAMEFLIANMPDRDLAELSAGYLLKNVRLAYQAFDQTPWKNDVPWEIFANNVLPYANINERRDDWREDFIQRFAPLIQDADTPALAAAKLNQKLFPLVGVKYSTRRPKADQSPLESINAGLASCTGLSVLLIDACRALGVPARFVGTPLWSDNSGNHSWIEVWDQGWHFTGAAEPSGNDLNKAWFTQRASTAVRDDRRYAIYAVSFQKTPIHFPLVWDRSIDYISAVNVTDRYVAINDRPPAGTVTVMVGARQKKEGLRVAGTLQVFAQSGEEVFAGTTKDESFDTNDFLQTHLPIGQTFKAELRFADQVFTTSFTTSEPMQPVIFFVGENEPLPEATNEDAVKKEAAPAPAAQGAAIAALQNYLAAAPADRPQLTDLAFASEPLDKTQAQTALDLLWQDYVAKVRADRKAEMDQRELVIGDLRMPFDYTVFGDKPAAGRSLYLSMHGGGGAPKRVNDQQWENQKRLYQPDEGIYLAPRAPTDTWNLWHQGHIDQFFDRLIENLIVLEDVNPNRVYLMGYSAGGDGVYQLAPRMADRLAAAAMMAGHPNETSPLGLRNLPFTLHMGALDNAYNRNKIAAEWQVKLQELQSADPQGYDHWVEIHEGKGHWMDRQDAKAVPWMAARTRQPYPDRVVWKQDDVVRSRFYWLSVDPADIDQRAEILAERKGNQFFVNTTTARQVTLLLNDQLIDFEQPVLVSVNGAAAESYRVTRTIGSIAKSLSQRGDRQQVFSAQLTVGIQPPASIQP